MVLLSKRFPHEVADLLDRSIGRHVCMNQANDAIDFLPVSVPFLRVGHVLLGNDANEALKEM